MPNIDGAITWPDFVSGYWFPLLQQDLVHGVVLFVVAIAFVSVVWDWLVVGLRDFIDEVGTRMRRDLIGRRWHGRDRIDREIMPGFYRSLDAETGATVVHLGWQNRVDQGSFSALRDDLIGPPPPLDDDDLSPATDYMWDGNEDD